MKQLIFAMMMLLAMSVTSCSKSDDDPQPQTQEKTDAALTGIWAKPAAGGGYDEAAVFRADGTMLLYHQNSGYHQKEWFHGTYTASGGTVHARLCKVNVTGDETDLDHLDYWAVNSPFQEWEYRYSIKGSVLTLTHYGETWTMDRR